jgi:hypothetical protein
MTLKADLYRALRIANDVNATTRGPVAIVRRVERKLLWRIAARVIGRVAR